MSSKGKAAVAEPSPRPHLALRLSCEQADCEGPDGQTLSVNLPAGTLGRRTAHLCDHPSGDAEVGGEGPGGWVLR